MSRTVQSAHGHLNTTGAAGDAPLQPLAGDADDSALNDELNSTLRSLLRAGLLSCVIADLFFGITDILFEPVHDFRIGFLRCVLLGAFTALWIATYQAWAVRRAVPLALLGLAVTCVLIAGPAAMHDNLTNPMVVTLALTAAVSLAAPWGIRGQLAAIVVTTLTTVVTIAVATGDLRVGLATYPPVTAAVVCGASLFGAVVCRRSALLSSQRGLHLLRSAETQRQAQETIVQLNADLERRVRERTAQLESTNARLELEVTERQRTAEALHRSQVQLCDIIDNTTAVIYLKDIDGRYMLVNSQYEAILQVRREHVVGQTDYDLLPRDTADAVGRNDREVLAANRALSFEEAIPLGDGIHTYVSVKFPLHDKHGEPYGVCGISTDITPRKQMEAQLRASEAQLSAVIENTNDAIWSVDHTYAIVVANAVLTRWFREIFGAELQSASADDQRVAEAESAQWLPLYERAFAGERLVFERKYTKGGAARSYLISINPIVTGAQVTGATVFAKDITDLRQAEARAREHQAELSHVLRLHTVGEMAAGLAHEINQPLAAIFNYARGCRNRILSGDTRLDEFLPVLDDIATQAMRSSEILRRLRLMVEKREPTREMVELNAVVSEAVRMMEAQVGQHGVALQLDLAPGLPAVEADAIQIEQVIVNLLLNGIEAMQATAPPARRVTVRTEAADAQNVAVVVRDTGSGLAPAVHAKMFEPFFTVKPTGLGMGLAISRSIVEGHGGRICAANHPDGGAVVRVVLPNTTAQS